MDKDVKHSWAKVLNTLDAHPTYLGNYSLSALLSCGRWAIVGRGWGKDWEGTVEGDGAMRVERYGVESYRVESGATKKEHKKRASKISLQSSLK